jgi:hypothetical protein
MSHVSTCETLKRSQDTKSKHPPAAEDVCNRPERRIERLSGAGAGSATVSGWKERGCASDWPSDLAGSAAGAGNRSQLAPPERRRQLRPAARSCPAHRPQACGVCPVCVSIKRQRYQRRQGMDTQACRLTGDLQCVLRQGHVRRRARAGTPQGPSSRAIMADDSFAMTTMV